MIFDILMIFAGTVTWYLSKLMASDQLSSTNTDQTMPARVRMGMPVDR
jgi:hypothetical protein